MDFQRKLHHTPNVEDEYGNTPAQRAELDWLLYNKPLEYAQMVVSGEIKHYLSLGCDQNCTQLSWTLLELVGGFIEKRVYFVDVVGV